MKEIVELLAADADRSGKIFKPIAVYPLPSCVVCWYTFEDKTISSDQNYKNKRK